MSQMLVINIPRTPGYTLFPYTTLFRSSPQGDHFVKGTCCRSISRFCKGPEHLNRRDGPGDVPGGFGDRSEEHTSELQSRGHLVCRLLLEKKKMKLPI